MATTALCKVRWQLLSADCTDFVADADGAVVGVASATRVECDLMDGE